MSIIHWIGIDDHADKWTIAQVEGHAQKPTKVFELEPGESAYRALLRFLKGLQGEVRVVYEAGPCGYTMYRRLTKAGITIHVAAPSLTPTKPGDKVKTNRRDATKLATLDRGNQLTYIAVPNETRESLRDLVRTRGSVQKDVGRLRRQIVHLLMRHGHRYRGGSAWTAKFWIWLKAVQLSVGYGRFILDEMMGELERRIEQLRRFDDEIATAAKSEEYAPYVAALCTLRGFSTLSAMTVLSELGDLRRFTTAPAAMAAVGLVPSEYSTGNKTNRYAITKTGNAHVRHIVVEAAWHYQRRSIPGKAVKARRKGQPPQIVAIAEKCEKRLHTRFYRLTSRGKKSTVAAVAIGRELVGFIWAIGQLVHP